MKTKDQLNFEFYTEELLKYRKQKGLSQEELANIVGVSRQSIYSWEAGKSIPDMKNIVKLCEELDITVDKLTNALVVPNNRKNVRKFKRKIFHGIFFIIMILFLVYMLMVIRKIILLGSICNKLSEFENLNNYYCKETCFKTEGKDCYDLSYTEIFFKDDVLKMIHQNDTITTIWIDYNKDEGYIFNESGNIVTKLEVEKTLFPKRSYLKNVATDYVDNSMLINSIYAFNPFFRISTNTNMYVLKDSIKIGEYEADIEESLYKINASPVSRVEYGNDGVNLFTCYEVVLDEVKDSDVSMPDLTEYNIK